MTSSPAQKFALYVGVSLTVAGIAGFLYSSDFSTGHLTGEPSHYDAVLGILNVNGWHNAVHLLTGLGGLAAARSFDGARRYALLLGVVYTGVALLGFVAGDGKSILGLIPVNVEDDILHTVIAALGIATAAATPSTPGPTLAAGQEGPGMRFD